MAGWFKVQRDIQEHWIWKSKEPFDKRSAWIDLILLANFKEFKTSYKGKIVCRKRGEVNTSVVYLAKRWRWDRRKVSRFLMALAADGMVSLNSTSDGTTVTIENYAKYQDIGTANGTTHGTGDGTTHGTHDKKSYIRSHKEVIDDNEWKEGEPGPLQNMVIENDKAVMQLPGDPAIRKRLTEALGTRWDE